MLCVFKEKDFIIHFFKGDLERWELTPNRIPIPADNAPFYFLNCFFFGFDNFIYL